MGESGRAARLSKTPLLVTKTLLPRRRKDVLRRGRLVDFLHRHVDRRLLLICGPAGYGKTTLLVDFAHEVDAPVCWYSISSEDADPKVFLRYLVASIARQFPGFGERTLALVDGVRDLSRDVDEVAGALVNELHAATSDFFLLVLDDYHLLDGQTVINQVIDRLLQHMPDNCHLVIASRTLPKITISRLAAHQQVAGLGVADLRFSIQEIRELLSRNHNILLPDKQAQELAKESEGWISAIVLTSHALWHGGLDSLFGAKASGTSVFDFLAAEVFDSQPPRIRSFLLASSVLSEFTAEQCAEFCGDADAPALLKQLEEANLFLNLIGDRWYRYHNLFREFLVQRLKETDSRAYAELNARAAKLAAERGDWDQVVNHYLRAGLVDEAARVIEARAEALIEGGQWDTVLQWTEPLLKTPAADRPAIKLARAQSLIYRGGGEEPHRLASEAVDSLRSTGDSAAIARALVARSIVLRARGRYRDAVADCEEALALARDDDALSLEVHKQLGACLGQQGKFAEAVAVLERALSLSRRLFREYDSGYVHYSLGVAYAKMGDLAKAAMHYQEAVVNWEAAGSPTHLTQALTSQGMLHCYHGDYDEALASFEAALARARECGHLRSEAYALASMGDAYRDMGRYAEAVQRYETALGIADRIRDAFLIVYTLSAIGSTYRLQGDAPRAERTIRRALTQAEERGSQYEIGLCELALGAVYNELEEYGRAVRHLKRAERLLALAKARKEVAIVNLHLAQAAFGANRRRDARKHLAAAVDAAAELGYDEFLLVEGRRLWPLLSWGVSSQIGGRRLALILERLERERPVAPVVSVMPPLVVLTSPKMPSLKARAFGQSEVECDGVVMGRQHWKTDKAREMLFFFLSHPGWLRRDQIICALWPELEPGRAESSFHTTLYRLRRALFPELIVQGEGRYRCNPEASIWYDVGEFESELARAKSLPDDAEEKRQALQRAIDLYKGSFLEECFSEWAGTKRERLEQQYLAALDSLARLLAAQGRLKDCLSLYQAVLRHDAFREDVQREVIRCYALMGNRAAAARHYREYVDFLARELGVRPSGRTQALYERIMRGEVGPREGA